MPPRETARGDAPCSARVRSPARGAGPPYAAWAPRTPPPHGGPDPECRSWRLDCPLACGGKCITLGSVLFVWDPEKAVSNERKHHVTFDEAVTVFADPLALVLMPTIRSARSSSGCRSTARRFWWCSSKWMTTAPE
jgi:hypothetical protein